MIEQRTYVDQVEITVDGTFQVRLKKAVFCDGKELMFEYHRTAIPPTGDCAAQLAMVNANLIAMGSAAVDAADWQARVGDLVPVVHSESVKVAYQEKIDAIRK